MKATWVTLVNFIKKKKKKKKKADFRVNFVLGSLYFVRTYVYHFKATSVKNSHLNKNDLI